MIRKRRKRKLKNISGASERKKYWDKQHRQRRREHQLLAGIPTEFAKYCLPFIKPGGKVLEIGIANGRDARYFVRENKNIIVGVDISTEAIRQLMRAATADGTINRILPIVANEEDLPKILKSQERYHAFYARSSLHLDDDKIIPFFGYVVSHLYEKGVIFVQGKPKEDFKITRSAEVSKNCFEDVDGHVRRGWSEEDIKALCYYLGLEIIEIKTTIEVILKEETKFIHFIAKKSKRRK